MYAPKILRKKKLKKIISSSFFFDFVYVISNYVSLSLSLCNIERRVNEKKYILNWSFLLTQANFTGDVAFFSSKRKFTSTIFFFVDWEPGMAGRLNAIRCYVCITMMWIWEKRKKEKSSANVKSGWDGLSIVKKKSMKAVTHSPWCADLISHFWFLDIILILCDIPILLLLRLLTGADRDLRSWANHRAHNTKRWRKRRSLKKRKTFSSLLRISFRKIHRTEPNGLKKRKKNYIKRATLKALNILV